MTTPVNGQGGSIKGLEFTWSLPSELLTNKAVRGFGVVLGGAYTDSRIQPWGPTGGTSPIAGLSRKVANVTFYYERYGFSARISERYRASTREYITNFGPPNFKGDVTNTGFSTAQPEKVVDAQVSYTLQAGPLKGLTFFLQAYNLNNEPLITYNNDDPRQVMNYQVYGSSYSAGASYKF
jgi:iron complex outermembrane receptor protein